MLGFFLVVFMLTLLIVLWGGIAAFVICWLDDEDIFSLSEWIHERHNKHE